MPLPNFVDELAAQVNAARSASSRKGQKAVCKPTRAMLLREFEAQTDMTSSDTHTNTWTIRFAYPPSTASITDLKPIELSDLRLETRHTGRLLIVRTFGFARAMAAIQVAVEDSVGDVDRLSVYNLHPSLAAQTALPQSQVFAIKEPFYKVTADGGYTIRVDHPTDLVMLDTGNTMIPAALHGNFSETNTSPQGHKDKGNEFYLAKDWYQAYAQYSAGIEACSDKEQILRKDLYRNLEASDGLSESKTNAYNSKALYRAARAKYELCSFDDAQRHFTHALSLTGDDNDIQKELTKTGQRLTEISTGVYDFERMQEMCKAGISRLDHASFISRVEVQPSDGRGRGLFACQDIKAGEVVLCEKAFLMSAPMAQNSEIYPVVNFETNSLRMSTHTSFLYQIMDKLRHNPLLARKFFDLHAADYKPRCGSTQVDSATVIDIFEVHAIIECNSYASGDVRNPQDRNRHFGKQGIWITASYVNHSCISNAYRSFHGDMMTIRAARDVLKGEEITMPYVETSPDKANDINSAERSWKFECQCVLCAADKKAPAAKLQERQMLWQAMSRLLESYPQTSSDQPSQTVLKQVEKLYHDLASTYDKTLYQDIPRLTLVDPGIWLCSAYSRVGADGVCKDYAIQILNNLGFAVCLSKRPLSISGANVLVHTAAMSAAMRLKQSYVRSGHIAVSKAFEDFAKHIWLLYHGDYDGFTSRYGNGRC